ncbi:GPH family glycoside/pentoside/hexuronide:cation symporter [Aeromonas hydrophila]|uniref:glycoside-pentoside-hexuronide (GPH):cation symporter n=1 Tax=Aeromonas hydrophila TaxID=644 RepID=UPI002169E7D7|nr:glycoside-pentoside-hexuronide (GPH):cation symporter [Aeromonas hydrophila]MCS3770371.1 GPH family glycoside/pentoside/hexuronide:cation symporter [Aeromonas hydrophila]MCS3793693.1 GPH family glycoside/pentoside/hexuronide:cation symporter [Aeromonas hydrophila]
MVAQSHNESRLPFREKFAYGVGDFGYNFVLNITTLYLLKFLTDVAGINAAWAGVIFLVAKVFTGFTDLGTGIFLDTRKRFGPRGKFRPMILWTILPLFIFNMLLFCNFDLDSSTKTILFILCFMGFGLFFSLGNASYGAMVPSMTKNIQDRAELAAWRQGGANTGLLLATVGFMPIALLFGSQETGYLVAALVYTSIGLAAAFFCYFNVKEHHTVIGDDSEKVVEKPTVTEGLKAVLKNNQLLVLAIANLLTLSAFNVKLSVQVFYAQYVIGDVSMIAYMSFVSMGCIYLGVLSVPTLVRRFGKKPVYLAGLCLWIAGDVANYLFGSIALFGSTVYTYVTFTSLAFFGTSFVNSLNWAFVSDTVEYGEWKTGTRTEGLVYCGMTFFRKCSQAIAGFVPGFALAMVGYMPNVEQTDGAKAGITGLIFIYPATLAVITALVMALFYSLNEARYKEIIAALTARRAVPQS